MKLFNLSKFYVLNVLAYFSLIANFIYVFYAIYLFKFKELSEFFAELEPFICTGIYYICCALVIVILLVLALIEFGLRKIGKIKTYNQLPENKKLAKSIFVLSIIGVLFVYFVLFFLLHLFVEISSKID